MPLIKSAKKKLRQDKKREKRNKSTKDFLKEVIKKAKKDPSEKNIRLAVQSVDKSVKKYIIHKNKAARIKSALAKLTTVEQKPETVKKKTTKKTKK